ncbi:alcohol dehydrogenase catalytic domain-containing protein [Streptomyces sp. Tu 6176]|uniref:alcohol dehydrogenase catalytic domain-containing protein n=1 Tax=Streptomyces sp. Tu 6176 TaxID=1470557 RepID=UPI000A77B1E0|nr:alcohol dehydrogenase catalytic domain-containing protein [Streptomyces sp. Tu 6176]
MSRAVRYQRFGGPEVLELREIAEPHAAPGEVRVRVTAAGLNPMDWQIAAQPDMAARFGIALPAGFGSDFAGVVDEVGAAATGFAVGDRVYGAAIGRSVADFVLVGTPTAHLWPIPEASGTRWRPRFRCPV